MKHSGCKYFFKHTHIKPQVAVIVECFLVIFSIYFIDYICTDARPERALNPPGELHASFAMYVIV